MYYIVVKQPPMYYQMTLEDFLFGTDNQKVLVNPNEANTRTYEVEEISERFANAISVDDIIQRLAGFNQSWNWLRGKERHELYRTFYIPKKSGGLRKINAPNDDLMTALRELKTIFEEDCKALYHTSAFAYIKHRCTIDAVKKHQSNKSRWFAKFDLSDFFGSTSLEFVLKMFGMVYPFSEVLKCERGMEELTQALELGFLDGGLPQGTPLSPIITNIMMIPIDFTLSKWARNRLDKTDDGEWVKAPLVYTRYADDFLISSRYTFDHTKVQQKIVDILAEFEAPFTIKAEKTRYGSSAGSNWNLGVMLNKDNNITIGRKRKEQFKAMLSSYARDKLSGHDWDLSDVQVMEGHRNYYRMVERDNIDGLCRHLSEKFGLDIVESIKADLRGCS